MKKGGKKEVGIDWGSLEQFFSRPGGRQYLQNISLILIHTLPNDLAEKEKLYTDFVEALDGIEKGIRQKQGAQILNSIFVEDEQA